MDIRYYLYISDAKVDMLLSQIDPSATKKLAREFSVDIKIFSAKQSTERAEGEDRVSRLEAVVKYLRDHDEIGTLEQPGRFVEGSLAMQWGPYGDAFAMSGEASPVVYFGGSTEGVIVGLGGSATHVIGASPGEAAGFSHSATPALLAALARDLEEEPDLLAHSPAPDDGERQALVAVHLATSGLSGPAQQLEFVAKRLLEGPSPFPHRDPHDGMRVLLGSPLYVAMAE